MACPRCGGAFEEYTLDGARAVACESCGYVDVPADHHHEPAEPETWDEAISRARDRRRPELVAIGDTIYRVAPELRERFEELTGPRQAVVRELLSEADPDDPERTRMEIGAAAGVDARLVSEVLSAESDLLVALSGSEVVAGR